MGAWDNPDFTKALLASAGQHGYLAACKWLRSVGAQWPDDGLVIDSEVGEGEVWKLNTLQWARAEGCHWGDWTSNVCHFIKKEWQGTVNEPELLEWVHENGCPCDCPRPYQLYEAHSTWCVHTLATELTFHCDCV